MYACDEDAHMCFTIVSPWLSRVTKTEAVTEWSVPIGVCVDTNLGPSSATANLKSSLRTDKQAAKGESRNPTKHDREKVR